MSTVTTKILWTLSFAGSACASLALAGGAEHYKDATGPIVNERMEAWPTATITYLVLVTPNVLTGTVVPGFPTLACTATTLPGLPVESSPGVQSVIAAASSWNSASVPPNVANASQVSLNFGGLWTE